jgi:predicted acetyltransferase
MDFELRPITRDELPVFVRVDGVGFGFIPEPDRVDGWATLDFDRTLAAFDGDDLVGASRNYSLEVTPPGAAPIPAAGLSWVSVLPTHRRQGILRAMMGGLLDDAVARNEPVAILTASESGIYSRFGFGVATRVLEVELERVRVQFRDAPPAGRLRLVDRSEAEVVAMDVFEQVRSTRTGAVARPKPWWNDEFFDPRPKPRGVPYNVVFESDAGIDGLATYWIQRTRPGEEAPFAFRSATMESGTVEVFDVIAATEEANRALWQFLCEIDLTTTIRSDNVPLDTPLPWMLVSPRAMRVTNVADWLWLRVLDAPRALEARRYAVEDRLVLELRDDFRPHGGAAGRFALDGGPDGASATRTDSSPDLVLGVDDFGGTYLGDTPFSVLARTGRVEEHTDGALARADAMFAADRAPFGWTHF